MSIVVVTPTGDRPECISLLKKWIDHQTLKPDKWLVIDDGIIPTKCLDGMIHIRRERTENDVKESTLGNNLEMAFRFIELYDVVIIMEDDDYYAPEYIENTMALFTTGAELVGWSGTPYYHVGELKFRMMGSTTHASLSQTAFTASCIPFIKHRLYEVEYHPISIDLRMWRHAAKPENCLTEWSKYKNFLSMKGMSGRKGAGIGHNPNRGSWVDDYDCVILKKLCKDWEVYVNHRLHCLSG